MTPQEIASQLSHGTRSVLQWLQPNPSGDASFDLEDIERTIKLGLVNRIVREETERGVHFKFSLTDTGRAVADLLGGE